MNLENFLLKKNFFSYSNHKKWLALVLKNKKESIFIIKFKKKTIGILREKCIKKKNYLSWVIKEKFRGKNHGKKMLKAFISLSKKKYYAKIHKNNFASLKICKSAGFKEYSKYNGFITFKK